jgi:hypothetical protein
MENYRLVSETVILNYNDNTFYAHRGISGYYKPTEIRHQNHGQLFDELKQCIQRKDVFLHHDNHGEYVDIEAIFSQGYVFVDNELRWKLSNF